MTETLTSNEKSYRNSICCAFSMTRYAEIELLQQQAQDYAEARVNKNTSMLSDQQLLFFFLDENQQEPYRKKYAHMDLGIVPEQIDTKLIPLPIIHQIGEHALTLAQVS